MVLIFLYLFYILFLPLSGLRERKRLKKRARVILANAHRWDSDSLESWSYFEKLLVSTLLSLGRDGHLKNLVALDLTGLHFSEEKNSISWRQQIIGVCFFFGSRSLCVCLSRCLRDFSDSTGYIFCVDYF